MKNPVLLILILWAMSPSLYAQVNLLKAEEHLIEATINLTEDDLSNLQSNSAATLALHNGELDIIFPLRQSTRDQFYNISFEVSLNGESLSPLKEDLKGFVGQQLTATEAGTKRITWMRLIDTHKQLEGQLKVKVNVELRGTLEMSIDCSNPPSFTKKQKLPYYIAGGTGLLAIGIGQLFKNKSDDIYDNDYLPSTSLEEAQPNYDDANSAHHAYLVLTYTGTAIVLADVVMYLIRNGKYKKRLKVYEKFCNGNSLSVSPLIQVPVSNKEKATSGLQLTFTF